MAKREGLWEKAGRLTGVFLGSLYNFLGYMIIETMSVIGRIKAHFIEKKMKSRR